MKQFEALVFSYLPNGAHHEFFDRATREIAKAGPAVKNTLGPLTGELNSWFGKETDCVMWYRKSALTDAIAGANIRLDRAITGFSIQVNGARYDTDRTMIAAAERLYIMIKSYGRVIEKPYLQEVGAVNAILRHLNGDLSADVTTTGLTRWPGKISEALNTFINLMEQREAKTLLKPEEGFRVVRRGIEGVWRRIVALVNSGAVLGLSPDYGALIDRLNPEINYLNSEYHCVRYNIARAEPDPIEPQAYTGQPVTPTPRVLYTTPRDGAVTLEPGKDFNFAFKHNVKAGNAQCIIRGKGKYRGNRTVTFIIA
ncbi:MAG: DUF6261 family protein [Tannerella sp.]|jgi:hypothetical protein|nr:DUF6261 family protein [Tannerella sp.]